MRFLFALPYTGPVYPMGTMGSCPGPRGWGGPALRRALRGLGILEIASSFVVFTCVCWFNVRKCIRNLPDTYHSLSLLFDDFWIFLLLFFTFGQGRRNWDKKCAAPHKKLDLSLPMVSQKCNSGPSWACLGKNLCAWRAEQCKIKACRSSNIKFCESLPTSGICYRNV